MIEALTVISAFLGIASMIGGLLGILFTVTVAFSRIRVVEAKIAAPGAYLVGRQKKRDTRSKGVRRKPKQAKGTY